MKTTRDYLDALRVHFKATSDYQLTKHIKGLSRARISSYRTDRTKFDDYMCMQTAEILGLDPLEVIANIQAERESRPHVRQYWIQLAHRLGKAAAVISAIALLSLFSFSDNSTAYALSTDAVGITNIGLVILIWLSRRALQCRLSCRFSLA